MSRRSVRVCSSRRSRSGAGRPTPAEAECEQYAAPISWTPGIGCDVPCEQDEFSGCGELAIGPQGCILLLADSGEI